ncbi:hypothetical protein FB565_000792 [Actinoplanes lutulentus]|uniref:Uncharacterized protein n=1 Tax=Actinoplanes lutulentus TaxID=1287878 RepID=A0A327ZKB7_9ACTN|nr:hypothetical protein [Actinoplanes lutulentus]MBB2941088.1 hypothetical protein [Actinoplanes lutulentus]RAK43397.1 hypothetical protein B0I29_101527 [Actinoplanes lutulentus]
MNYEPSARLVPMRDDRWQPQDELLNSVMDKCIDDAYRGANTNSAGGSPIMVAGGMILLVLGVILAAGTGSPLLAVAIVVAVALGGLGYMAMAGTPTHVNKLSVLDPIGGPGNLPGGYIVHPKAWQAGMREYLIPVTDRQFRVAVRICREHPGSVSDVIRLVKKAEKHAYQHSAGVEVMDVDVFKVAARWTAEHARNAPTMVMKVAAK